MARLVLSLLGPFELRINGESAPRIEADKVRALLAYLAVEHHRTHRREVIGELLWPERSKDAIHNNLRKVLFKLRQAICDAETTPPHLLTTHKTIQWNSASDYMIDVSTFESLMAATREHQHSRLEDCDACIRSLEQAIRLYCGDFLADLYLEDSAEFEDWAIVKRESLRRQAVEALKKLSAYYQERTEYTEAVDYARHWIMLDSLSEEAHRHLIQILALAGQRSEALTQYRTCRDILAKELGLEPCEETTQLYNRILAGEFQRIGMPLVPAHSLSPRELAAASNSSSAGIKMPARGAETYAGGVMPKPNKLRLSRLLRFVLGALVVILVAGTTASTIGRLGGSMGSEQRPTPTEQLIGADVSGLAAGLSVTPDPWGDVVIPAGGTVRIAALGPATGSMETLFARMRASMNLAAREHGQVHNLDVSFVMFDTRANQSYALDAAQAVAADPTIVAVIGPVISVEGPSVLPVLEEAHVLSISPSATRYNLTTFGPMTFNRVVLNQYQPGSQLGLEVDGLPEVQAFYAAHPELIERLTADMRVFAPLTYDATLLLLVKLDEVIVVASDGSIIIGRRLLADAIRSTTNYPGVTGSITIDETGNRVP